MTEIIAFIVIAVLLVIVGCVAYSHYRLETRQLQQRRCELNKRLAESHKEIDLLVALSKQILPLKEDMDRLGANVAGRHAVVKIDDWPEQYAFGIKKCVGFILDWK